jgi:hypothetical protein
LALFLKVFRNRLSCHVCQCGRTGSVKSVSFWPLGESYRDVSPTTIDIASHSDV